MGLDPLGFVTKYSDFSVTVPGMETTVEPAGEGFKTLNEGETVMFDSSFDQAKQKTAAVNVTGQGDGTPYQRKGGKGSKGKGKGKGKDSGK